MKLLIKQAKIIDPGSPHHGKTMDIFIRNGRIIEIKKKLHEGDAKVFQWKGLHISPGWVDIGAQVGEPGFEHRETLATAAAAAVSGGYTTLACFPNTSPVLHSKSEISFILKSSSTLPVDILPIGALSRDCAGKDIAEILDMHANGAVAFSDGKNPVHDSGLLLRALLYVRKFNGLIIHNPYDKHLSPDGQMHEGRISTGLGLKGIPSLAEYLMLRRDIKILEYASSRLHLHAISAKESVQQIREAKKAGLSISASCPAINLLLEDESLQEFDGLFKVLPPLREHADRKALMQGIRDGHIDTICSNHVPRNVEEKHREFSQAAFGSTGLETAFAAANTALRGIMDLEKIIETISIAPRKLLGLPVPHIMQGNEADLSLFDPQQEWTVSDNDLKSLSHNEALLGVKLKGRALGIVKKGILSIERKV